jgi:NAD+ synthetase
MPVLDPQGLIGNRVAAIRAYHEQAKLPKAELDVSGGVDSAVMLGLLARALGAENVAAVYSSINSSRESLERAREVCEAFGVRLIELDLSDVFAAVRKSVLYSVAHTTKQSIWDVEDQSNADPTINGGFRSCFRAPIGRYINRLLGGIRHGTGNEDEDRWLRFFQKGGDGEVDTNPIEMLSKGEVWQLAIALGVPKSIIAAKPTPDLWGKGEAAHTDEMEIRSYLGLEGLPLPMYSVIDPETGEYLQSGVIERVNRFLSKVHTVYGNQLASGEKILLDDLDLQDTMRESVQVAVRSGLFPELTQDEVLKLLRAVRKAERKTRHKKNDNIPMLGNRDELVEDGILTDDLSK